MDYTEVLLLVVFLLEAIAGLWNNVFILFVIVHDRLRGETVASVNKILVALAVSNTCFSLVVLVNILRAVFWQQTCQTIEFAEFAVTMLWLTSSSWLTAWLCFFYFIKIIHFTSGFLAWVKTRIDSAVRWMILVAGVVAVCCFFIQVLIYVRSQAPLMVMIPMNPLPNTTQKAHLNPMYASVAFTSNFVPFPIVFATTMSTICSLKRHSHRMERNMGSAGAGPLKTHQRPVTMMSRLLLFYAIYYVELYFYYFKDFVTTSTEFLQYVILMFSFAPLQSLILIYSIPKLKAAFQRFLCFFLRDNVR